MTRKKISLPRHFYTSEMAHIFYDIGVFPIHFFCGHNPKFVYMYKQYHLWASINCQLLSIFIFMDFFFFAKVTKMFHTHTTIFHCFLFSQEKICYPTETKFAIEEKKSSKHEKSYSFPSDEQLWVQRNKVFLSFRSHRNFINIFTKQFIKQINTK